MSWGEGSEFELFILSSSRRIFHPSYDWDLCEKITQGFEGSWVTLFYCSSGKLEVKIKVRNRRRCRESAHASPDCLSCLLLIALDAKTTDAIIKFSSTLRQIEGKQDQIRGVRIFLDSVYILKIFDQSLTGTRVLRRIWSVKITVAWSAYLSARDGDLFILMARSFLNLFILYLTLSLPPR